MKKLQSSEYTIFIYDDERVVMMKNTNKYEYALSNLCLTTNDISAYVLYKKLNREQWEKTLKGIVLNSTVERLNVITGQDFVVV